MEEAPAVSPRTLEDLKKEHGHLVGSRLVAPQGEVAEQSPVRNYVRDLVLGFNDGLVSVYAITAGVAGAAFTPHQTLVAGLAASVAGGLSMAAGEYISTKSQADFYAAERARESEHLEKWPQLEIQELRESLEEKGLQQPLLEQVVVALSSDRKKFLDFMMREEFGVGRESERSPWRAAAIVMAAFLVGAFLSAAPYGFLATKWALLGSSILSLAGLFVAGLLRAHASRLPRFRAGVEMVFIGAIAAAITFFVGRLIGVAV